MSGKKGFFSDMGSFFDDASDKIRDCVTDAAEFVTVGWVRETGDLVEKCVDEAVDFFDEIADKIENKE